jgi:hypothetical protein
MSWNVVGCKFQSFLYDAVRSRAIEGGAVQCLFKPFSDTALLDALDAALKP